MNDRITPDKITFLQPNEIFVFGSNRCGFHGGGAARIAMEHFGAKWGEGLGLTGKCYAIDTMSGGIETIRPQVNAFLDYAKKHSELKFLVTRIGCGIAGYTDKEIAPLFAAAQNINNIYLPKSFWDIMH